MSTKNRKNLEQAICIYLIAILLNFIVFGIKIDFFQLVSQTQVNFLISFIRIIVIFLILQVSKAPVFKWTKEQILNLKNYPLAKKKYFIITVFYFFIFIITEIVFKNFIVGEYLKASLLSYVVRYFVSAFFEELIFKGFLYRGFKTDTLLSFWHINIIVSLAFALIHFQYFYFPLQLFLTFIEQFLYIILFNIYSSIWAITLIHAARNFIMYLIVAYL